MNKVVFQLETLTCPSCVKHIENALCKQNGVVDAKLMFQSSKLKAQYDRESVTAEQIEETIVNLGYLVLSRKVSSHKG